MIHDMVELEKAGIPTVQILSHGFEEDAEASAKAFGLAGIRYAVVPKVYRNLPVDECVAQTDPVIDRLVELLTTPVDGEEMEELARKAPPTTRERFEGADQFDALERMNEAFIQSDWGDGYPLIAPTEERVEAMLRGTTLAPQDVVCMLPPGNGVATVEKIAINAVMAGCKPEHLPVVMAAARAIAQMDPTGVRGGLMSTSANAPLLLVNGPIARELGINWGRCALGPGKLSRVNVVIGRALILALKNVGHWYPGVMDMDTIGTPRKFSHCVAENEEDSPWEPYHVEQGFPPEASTVTVFITAGDKDVADQGNTEGDALLRTIAYSAIWGGHGHIGSLQGEFDQSPGGGTLVFIAPAHARPIAASGYTKWAIKEFLYHHCKVPARQLINSYNVPEKVRTQWRWLYQLSPVDQERVILPVHRSPDRYFVACVGANDRAKDMVFPVGSPSTVEVEHRA